MANRTSGSTPITTGAITQNTGTFAFKDYEFVDLNGNGTPDLELAGEVYKCGLLVADTKLLTLLDAANVVTDTDRTNIDGYYRFRELALAPWTVTIDASNASLIAAAQATFAAELCKPVPSASAPLSADEVSALLASQAGGCRRGGPAGYDGVRCNDGQQQGD